MGKRKRDDLKQLLDRVFIERELFLRANDKVRYLRLSARLQKTLACAAVIAAVWMLFSTTGLFVQRGSIAARDRAIQEQKVAYLELLTEVGEYHDQFARLTQNLEDNQGYLLSLLENGRAGEHDRAAVLKRLAESDGERDRLAVTREGLRNKLEAFEGELGAIADRNATLHKKVAELRSRLSAFEVAESEIKSARERLGARLRDMEQALAEARQSGKDLRGQLETANSELAQARQAREGLEARNGELQQQIAQLDQQLAVSQKERSQLHGDVTELRQVLRDSDERRNALERERVALVARAGDLGQRLEQAGTREEGLEARIVKLEDGLAEAVSRGDSLKQERDRLTGQVAGLERNLSRGKARSAELEASIAALNENLREQAARAESLVQVRDELQGRIAEFEQRIADAATARAGLERRISELDSGLSQSRNEAARLKQERSEREAHVAALEEQIGGAAGEKAALEQRISELEGSLSESEERGKRAARERNFYEARVTGLEKQLDDMREIQEGIVKRLTSQTLSSMDAMEKTVAMTGVDVDSLLRNVSVEESNLGQGGPFVPGDFISETDPTYALQASVALLDLQMDRWEALQKVVRQLPLMAPLDTFRLTSGFGGRIDPLNGRKARHLGLDFSAPLRSPVFSTAPGKVVFAGWRGRYGRLIEIDHGFGIHTRYAHLKKIKVQPGQEVGHHEEIGLLGSSGRSTGPHVHYEILIDGKQVDPSNFLEAGRYVFKG